MKATVCLQRKGKSGVFHLRLVWEGKERQRSLETADADEADAYLTQVKQSLHLIRRGQLHVPTDVSIIDFLITGGKRKLVPANSGAATLASVKDRYLVDEAMEAAPTYLGAQRTHLKHLLSALGGEREVRSVTTSELHDLLQARKQRHCSQTAIRMRNTLRKFFAWMERQGLIAESPASKLPVIKDDSRPKPFRTITQIEEAVKRGSFLGRAEKAAWKGLFLGAAEIAALLQVVRANAKDERAFLLHVLAAYTGMRRGEILKLMWLDIDFELSIVIARSRKQSRRRRETPRRIALHPELAAILKDWQVKNPAGEFVVAASPSLRSLTTDEANRLFWSPLRHTDWCLDSKRNWFKLGFHTYRHSFVSNLAAAGVDPRVIREFVGHTSEQMQWRYLHLFPEQRQKAIRTFSLQAVKSET